MNHRWTLALAFGLAACASPVTPDECAATNWRGLGYAAGAAGRAMTEADRRFAQCAETGVPGDGAAYRRGYEDGLARYCSFDGVLEAALRGEGDILFCPDASFAMEEAYDAGRSYHAARRDRDAWRQEAEDARTTFRRSLNEADRLRDKIPYIDDPQRRDELRREIERLRSEAYRAEQRGRRAEYEWRRAEDRLRDASRRLDRLRARAGELRRLDRLEREDERARARDREEAGAEADDAFPPLTD